jgi:hypothetical protein
VTAVAVLAITGGIAIAANQAPSPDSSTVQGKGTGTGTPRTGWRLESSLGVELQVPANWAVNDSGCGMTDRPSIVRAKGISTLCYTPEPTTKELAVIAEAVTAGGQTQPTTVDGVDARRGERRLDDGRYAGWLEVPSRKVGVEVRTRDKATTSLILDSVRLVDIDSRGCTTDPGKLQPAKAASGQSFVPQDPDVISVCYYGGETRLQASAELTGDAARTLATALNGSPKGGNPDRPADSCAPATDPAGADAVLLVEGATVRVRFDACTKRGADNGAETVQVNQGINKMFMEPIHAGYGFDGDLPS